MKKTLIALAAIAAVGAASAQTTTGAPGFQITGNFNAGYVANDYKGNTVSGFEQNGMGTSQINFRGLEDLGGGMSAYFQHSTDWQFATIRGDTGTAQGVGVVAGVATPAGPSTAAVTVAKATNNVAPNIGSVTTFGNDQKMVGLRGSFGDIAFGTINNGTLYNYVVVVSPIAGTSYGSGYGTLMGADPTFSVVRWDNTFQYKTPNIGGFVGQIQYSAKQNTAGAALANYSPGLGLTDVIGATEIAGKYVNGPLTVGFALTGTDGTALPANTGLNYKATQNSLAAAFEFNSALKVTGGYQVTSKDGFTNADGTAKAASKKTSFNGGIFYTVGPTTYWGQYGNLDDTSTATTVSTTMTSGGIKYALSKMTSLEARYESIKDDAGQILATGFPNLTGTNNTRVRSTVGINVNF